MTNTPDEVTDHMNLDQFEKATALLDPDWLDQAVCQDMNLDLFFNYDVQAGPALTTMKTCRSCPVRKECLLTIAEFESNLNTNLGKGFYAGLTPSNRRKLYNTVAMKNWIDVSQDMIDSEIKKREEGEWSQSAYEIEKRAVAHRLAASPKKTTRYCSQHNYPIVGLRAEKNPKAKVMLYGCYFGGKAHYLYRVNDQLLNREEYEQLCAAK